MTPDQLPQPFNTCFRADELPFATLARQVRALAVAAYGTEVDYQGSVAWTQLVEALEQHRALKQRLEDAESAFREFRGSLSDALDLSVESDEGHMSQELDTEELLSAVEFLQEELENERKS